MSMIPTRTGKQDKIFSVRKKSENFDQTEKVREITGKLGNLIQKNWGKTTEKVREICQPEKIKIIEIW